MNASTLTLENAKFDNKVSVYPEINLQIKVLCKKKICHVVSAG